MVDLGLVYDCQLAKRPDEARDDLRQRERAPLSFCSGRRPKACSIAPLRRFFCEFFYSRIDNTRVNFKLDILCSPSD
jgi:hypothetical protein